VHPWRVETWRWGSSGSEKRVSQDLKSDEFLMGAGIFLDWALGMKDCDCSRIRE
jgi:hypothetical protein